MTELPELDGIEELTIAENNQSDYKTLTYASYVFWNIKQEPNQTFKNFLTKIRIQCKKCEFGEGELRNLKDKIILGIRDNALRDRLLRSCYITLEQVIKACKAAESSTMIVLNKRSNKRKQSSRCPKCELPHATDFKKGETCGVLSSEVGEILYLEKLFTNKVINKYNWLISGIVNSKPVIFKLDTGAQANIICESILHTLDAHVVNSEVPIHILTFSGEKLPTLGETFLTCFIKNNHFRFRFIVTNIDSPPLLGLDACCDLKVINICTSRLLTTNNVNDCILSIQK